MTTFSTRGLAMATAATGLALVGWDLLRLDMPLARWWGDAQGFALRDYWVLDLDAGSLRKLGGKAWSKLHKLVYPAIALGI